MACEEILLLWISASKVALLGDQIFEIIALWNGKALA